MLKETYTNQTLHAKGHPITINAIAYPEPRIRTSVAALSKKGDERIREVLHKIHQEDPTLQVEYNNEISQLLIYGQVNYACRRVSVCWSTFIYCQSNLKCRK